MSQRHSITLFGEFHFDYNSPLEYDCTLEMIAPPQFTLTVGPQLPGQNVTSVPTENPVPKQSVPPPEEPKQGSNTVNLPKKPVPRQSRKFVNTHVKEVDSNTSSNSKRFPAEITKVLRDWLREHSEYPYPTMTDKDTLCEATGLTRVQIEYWFINARKRILKHGK